LIESQGAAPNIPDKANRKINIASAPRSTANGTASKRFFNRVKHYRRIATRFEKHAANYLAMLKLTAIRIWLRVNDMSPRPSRKRACIRRSR
jgi:hypothetical protein